MNQGDRGRGQPRAGQPPRAKAGARPPEKVKRPSHRVKFDPDDMLDMRLRIGLEEHEIRLSKRDYGLFVQEWKLSGLDVIFRCVFANHERNIVLRGCEGGYESVSACDTDRNIPVYNVISILEMRRKALVEQGLE